MKPARAAKPKPVGRPTKYTPARVRKITRAIADGMPSKFAAAEAGISVDTFCTWKNLYPEFSEAVQRAEARGIHSRLRAILRSAKRGHKAAAWWLEHVHPEHFAKSRVEHSHVHSGEVAVKMDLKKLTTEELRMYREILLKAQAPRDRRDDLALVDNAGDVS